MSDCFNLYLSRTIFLWVSLAIIIFCAQCPVHVKAQSSEILSREMTIRKRPSELLYGHFGHGKFCNVQGKRYTHGQIFATSKCLQSRCFMGTIFMHSEGCEDSDGGCHDVNSQWVEDCITYTCSKTTSGGYKYYQPIVTKALCWDHFGGCHKPGQIFQLRMESYVHPRCLCKISKDVIYYHCYKAL